MGFDLSLILEGPPEADAALKKRNIVLVRDLCKVKDISHVFVLMLQGCNLKEKTVTFCFMFFS